MDRLRQSTPSVTAITKRLIPAMNNLNHRSRPHPLTCLLLGLVLLPASARAALPAGQWQVHVSNPTNNVWDASRISELQSPEVEFEDDSVAVSFDGPFIQTAAGKLTGAGTTQFDVMADIYNGPVDGMYVAKGAITSAKGIARLTFASAVKGPVVIEERSHMLASALAVKATINSVTQSVTGSYTATAAASGYGALKETGVLDFPWEEVVAAMGDGGWTLHLSLTNDAVKKVGGTASVGLSGGATLGFTAKGIYKPKTGATLLVLSPDLLSKGSSLKVTLNDSNSVVALSGKLSGQAIKTVGTLTPE